MGKQAIDAKRGQYFWVSPYRPTLIGIDTPHKEGEHPLWDERIGLPPEENMIRNIAVRGVLEAVACRKNGKHKDGPFAGEDLLEVIDGRQRVKACRLAYDRAIAAGEEPPLLKIEIVRGSEETHHGIMISKNELRRSDGAAVRAKKAGRLIQLGHEVSDVANMFGVTEENVENWLRFNELILPVRRAVDQGKINYSSALQLCGKSREAQEKALPKLLEVAGTTNGKRGVTTRIAKRIAEGEEPSKPKRFLTPAQARALAQDEEFFESLSDDAQELLRIFGGEDRINRVAGLREALEAR